MDGEAPENKEQCQQREDEEQVMPMVQYISHKNYPFKETKQKNTNALRSCLK